MYTNGRKEIKWAAPGNLVLEGVKMYTGGEIFGVEFGLLAKGISAALEKVGIFYIIIQVKKLTTVFYNKD